MNEQYPEIGFELFSRALESQLSVADNAELNRLLQVSPQARLLYIEYIQMNAQLYEFSQRIVGQVDADEDMHGVNEIRRVINEVMATTPSRRTSRLSLVLMTCLAMCVIAIPAGIIAHYMNSAPVGRGRELALQDSGRRASSTDKAWIARIVDPFDAVMEGGQPDVVEFAAGEALAVKEGTLKILFSDGATLLFEGPGRLRFYDSHRVSIERGRAVFDVANGLIPVLVHTPTGDYTDIGTRFGIEVTASSSEAHVFEGAVEGRPLGDTSEPLLIESHQAARFGNDGQQPQIFEAEEQRFAEGLRLLSGIKSMSGDVYFYSQATAAVHQSFPPDGKIALLLEQDHFLVSEDVPIYEASPGSYDSHSTPHPMMLSKDTRVSSFLLHGDFQNKKTMSCSITFDRPILGFVCESHALCDTDANLGNARFSYPNRTKLEKQSRGFIFNHKAEGEPRDMITISEDRKKMTVYMEGAVPSLDQLRVVLSSSR